MRKKILFISESVSLAHIARPSLLASTLSHDDFDIHLASSGQYRFCYERLGITWHELPSLSPMEFLYRLRRGQPIYSALELQSYVSSDLAILNKVEPDLVVSDFRLSLPTSGKIAQTSIITVCNAHWSPYFHRVRIPAPDLFFGRIFSMHMWNKAFNVAWPLASKIHLYPINKVRQMYSLPPYKSVNEYYCDGDTVLYADPTSLFKLSNCPENHKFIGPIIWSPAFNNLPKWWDEMLSQKTPPIYITLGTTGDVNLLPMIIKVCAEIAVPALVATAGRSNLTPSPPMIFSDTFLPGSDAASIASAVICNGGSATAYQALSCGKPVLGICTNLDQVMTMEAISKFGAGRWLLAREATPDRIYREILQLRNESYSAKATQLANEIAEINLASIFGKHASQ